MLESAKKEKAAAAKAGGCPVDHTAMKEKKEEPLSLPSDHAALQASGAECPVDHEARSKFIDHAKSQKAKAAAKKAPAALEEGCDSSKMDGGYKSPDAYNVYGEKINPNNMMPNPNQLPLPGQVKPLSVERVKVRGGFMHTTWICFFLLPYP